MRRPERWSFSFSIILKCRWQVLLTYCCSSSPVIYWVPGALKERDSSCTRRLLSKIDSCTNTHFESDSHIYFDIGLPSTQMVGLGAGQGVVFNGLYYKGWIQACWDAALGVFRPQMKNPSSCEDILLCLPTVTITPLPGPEAVSCLWPWLYIWTSQPGLPGPYSKVQALSGAVSEGCPGVLSTAVALCVYFM